jgi:hypothetical protein
MSDAPIVLLVGSYEGFRAKIDEICDTTNEFRSRLTGGYVVAGIRYVHVTRREHAQGFPRDATTYRSVGRDFSRDIMDALAFCSSRYERDGAS